MDLKQITEEAEKLMTEHMQDAINATEQWQREMYYNWAYGVLILWRKLASAIISSEHDNSEWLKIVAYRDSALNRFENEIVSFDRVPL
ncbi:hypothetical protein ACSJG3_13360 [Klebsiella pneumoniae]|uniref:hypothetical protein n=1 Tax=Klebsiella pneumoniae TaxID=573 RepID=UPI003EE3AFCD